MVSQYNAASPDEVYGVKGLASIVSKRIKMQGFIVGDPNMGPKYATEHEKNVSKWISDGTFKAQQSITEGIDNAIGGLLGMLRGENFGKAVLTIKEIDEKVNRTTQNKSDAANFSSEAVGLRNDSQRTDDCLPL